MKSDLHSEYSRLSKVAIEALRSVPASGSYRRVFSFWEFPSFSPSYVWTVYSPHRHKSDLAPFADCTTWRSDIDIAKFESPLERIKHPAVLEPTIETESIQLSGKEVELLERMLQEIQIPIYIAESNVAGLDGSSYEFTFDRSMFGFTFSWWETDPVEWLPLTKRIREIIESLNKQKK